MYLTLFFAIFSIFKIVNIIYVYYLYSKYSFLFSNIIFISNLILISLFILITFSEVYFILVKIYSNQNNTKIIDFLHNSKLFFTVSLVSVNLIFIFNKLYDIYIFHLTLYVFNRIQTYILYNIIKTKELKVHPVIKV
jgi:hypothetical protein